MQCFRYALDPALDAARADERSAARAVAAARRAVFDAEARHRELVARARAIVERAAHVADVATFVDRERCLAVLALRRTHAAEIAADSARAYARARVAYEMRARRVKAFEAHRERALATYRLACDLAEAAEFEEANASGHEARSRALGKNDA